MERGRPARTPVLGRHAREDVTRPEEYRRPWSCRCIPEPHRGGKITAKGVSPGLSSTPHPEACRAETQTAGVLPALQKDEWPFQAKASGVPLQCPSVWPVSADWVFGGKGRRRLTSRQYGGPASITVLGRPPEKEEVGDMVARPQEHR